MLAFPGMLVPAAVKAGEDEMNNLTRKELDLIVAALNYADINNEAFVKHLVGEGHSETAKFGSPLRLNNLRWRFADEYNKK